MQNAGCSFGNLRQDLPINPCYVNREAQRLREYADKCLQPHLHKSKRPGRHFVPIRKSHEDWIESTFWKATMLDDVCFSGGTLGLTFGSIGLS